MLYDWLRALHLIAVIAWMAGMLYLPRLYVYHAGVAPASEASALFKIMERRLLRFIMNPAMIAVFLFGGWLVALNPAIMRQPFMHVKLLLVLLMAGLHGFLAGCRKRFASDTNRHSAKFYRILNEGPTVLLIGIVLLIIVKPRL